MKILVDFRWNDLSLVRDMVDAGHDVYAEHAQAVMFRKTNLPVQPVYYETKTNVAFMPPFEEAAQAPSIIDGFLDAHEREHFDAVALWTDAPFRQRCLVLSARSVGVPTFEVTHGWMNWYKQGHFECRSHVDHILGPGQHEVDFRALYGYNNVVITGKPHYDSFPKLNPAGMNELARFEIGIDRKRPVIVYAQTWRHPFSTWERVEDNRDDIVVSAFMNMKPVCNPYLIIKPHYSTGNSAVEEITESYVRMGVEDFTVISCDPAVALSVADLVVCNKGSIAVDALIFGKPVVMFEFRPYNDLKWFEGRGIKVVSRPDDLLPAMTRALLDAKTKDRLAKEREDAVRYFAHKVDGKSGQRCVSFIEQVVNERNGVGAVRTAAL